MSWIAGAHLDRRGIALGPFGLMVACGLAVAAGPGWGGYGAEEAARLRRAVTLENWDDGGELSRFAYLTCSRGSWSGSREGRSPRF